MEWEITVGAELLKEDDISVSLSSNSLNNHDEMSLSSSYPSNLSNTTNIQKYPSHPSSSSKSVESSSMIQSSPMESLFGPSIESIWKKKKRKGRTGVTSTSKNLPPVIATLLGEANMKYIAGEYEEALQLFTQVTELAPKHSDPYLSMGLIYEETGNKIAAFHYLQLAMKYSPRNCDLLFKVAKLAYEFGYYQKALSITNRIFFTDKSIEIFATKILLYIELNYLRRGKQLLKDMLTKYPSEYSFLLEYSECCYRNYFYSHGIQSVLSYISKSTSYYQTHSPKNNFSHDIHEEDEMKNAQESLLFTICDGLLHGCKVLFNIYFDIFQTESGLLSGEQLNFLLHPLNTESMEAHDSLFVACVSTLHFYITHGDTLGIIRHQADSVLINFWRESSLQNIFASEFKIDQICDSVNLSSEMVLIQCICALEQHIFTKKRGKEKSDAGELVQGTSTGVEQSATDEANWFSCLRYLFPILANFSKEEAALAQGLHSHIQYLTSESETLASDQCPFQEEKNLWLLRHIQSQSSSTDSQDFYELGDQIPITASNGEKIGTIQYRLRDDYKFLLYARLHLATLLMTLGMNKRALTLSREVAVSPFLSPALFSPLTIGIILKRHCVHLLVSLNSLKFDANSPNLLAVELVHEIMQVCVRVLECNPNDAECLATFASLSEQYHKDFMSLGINMITGHLQTFLAHFRNSKVYFETHITKSAEEQDDEGEGEDRPFEEGKEEPDEAENALDEVEEERDVETNNGANDSEKNLSQVDSAPIDKSQQYQDNLEENLEKIHSLPPSRLNKNPWETATNGLLLKEIDMSLEIRVLYAWARLSLEYHQDLVSYCSIVFPLVDCYCQYEKDKNSRIKKKKRKNPLAMSMMWKKNEVLNYPNFSWMSDVHWDLSRLTYSLATHVTHLHDALSLQDVWKLIETIKAHESDISVYIQDYKLDWIYNTTEKLMLTHFMTHTSTQSSTSRLHNIDLGDFPPLPDVEEEASLNPEDVRLIQSKASKKRKIDHSSDNLSGGLHSSLSCDNLMTTNDIQELLRFTLPTIVTSSPHPLLDANKDFIHACSSFSYLAGKCALKLLTSPNDVTSANILLKEFNAQGCDFINYDLYPPYEMLHLRQLLKSHPSCSFALLLCGHFHACRHRYAQALDYYLDSLYYSPDEPLIAFCLSIFMIFMSIQRHTGTKQEICMRGFMIYRLYIQLRTTQISQFQSSYTSGTTENSMKLCKLYERNIQQEIYYNLGLLYYQIKMVHLSQYYLEKVLAMEEQHQQERSQGQLALTKEAAFHLLLIYQEVENEEKAIEIMWKYLNYDEEGR